MDPERKDVISFPEQPLSFTDYIVAETIVLSLGNGSDIVLSEDAVFRVSSFGDNKLGIEVAGAVMIRGIPRTEFQKLRIRN